MSQMPAKNPETVISIGDTNQVEDNSLIKRGIAAITVAAAGGSLLFEQSPANEALRVNAGLEVLQNTGSAVAVGATIFGITAAIEGGSSALITAGLHSERGVVNKLKEKMSKKTELNTDPEKKEGVSALGRLASFGADVGIALGLGAGLVTVKHHVSDTEPSVSKDLKTSAKATAIVSSVSGAIGYLAAGGINHANGTILETPAELLVDYGTDTKFWVGALTIGYGIAYVKKKIQNFKQRRGDQNNIEKSQLEKEQLALNRLMAEYPQQF